MSRHATDEYGLTLLQRRFADEYLLDLNAADAFRRTGNGSKNPDGRGWKILSKPAVKAYIKVRQEILASMNQVTVERIVRRYAEIAFAPIVDIDKGVSASDALSALNSLGKHLGMFGKDDPEKRNFVIEFTFNPARVGTRLLGADPVTLPAGREPDRLN